MGGRNGGCEPDESRSCCYDPERFAPSGEVELHRCGPPLPPVMRSPGADDNTPEKLSQTVDLARYFYSGQSIVLAPIREAANAVSHDARQIAGALIKMDLRCGLTRELVCTGV